MIWTSTIPGEPVPASRPRVVSGHAYTPARYATWKQGAVLVLRATWRQPTLVGPVSVSVVALWTRPARRPACVPAEVWSAGERCWRPVGADADNVAKAVLDAGTVAKLWGDDAQVCDLRVRTMYAARGERACVVVEVAGLSLAGGV